MAGIVKNQLHLNGFIYYKVNSKSGRTYWICKRGKAKECSAKAITLAAAGGALTVVKGDEQSPQSHPPNREEGQAVKVVSNLKRLSQEHPGMPPAQIFRYELTAVPSGVLSQLPEREKLKKMMRRERRRDLPKNPVRLSELGAIPERFTKTLLGGNFLLFDSHEDPNSDSSNSDGENEQNRHRVIIFGTRRNLELLGRSVIWFLDGTFKVYPGHVVQIFTISGLVKRTKSSGEEEVLAAFLPSKKEEHYGQVLEEIIAAAREQQVPFAEPVRAMSDFELAILNSIKEALAVTELQCCFFHLGQSMYRKETDNLKITLSYCQVQQEGLQVAYNNPGDREVKIGSHMLLALAFIPPDEVKDVYKDLVRILPAELKPVVKYMKENYVVGTPSTRGRRRTIPAR
ncbi:FLYWCH-type zinc finger-containing protein 1 [Frankliniella fusca]|uniref:FLYWCH-type zinc finger-containing protein 1 n=1 Tax=Frankliniella fusca TaxID=407009 RepID=A0AAE1LPU9_9NEOP|nr:FLYWCH-type zinc finger-containing protein 1 [Frankliniella fusca]